MRKAFGLLGSDDTPMVRRAAAKWLGVCATWMLCLSVNPTSSQPFTKKMSKEHVISSALPVYLKLAADDQDSVRLLTVQDLIVIAQQLEPDEVKQQLLSQLRQSVADKSWRVRYMVANYFVEVRTYLSAIRHCKDQCMQ